MQRRTALLATLILVFVGFAAAPAEAATTGHRVAGPRTEVLRASAPPSSRAALRRSNVVAGEPATTHYSTWSVTYVGAWTTPARTAFQRAVDTWAGILHSGVPIRVNAEFADLGPGVLGSAGPDGVNQDPALGDGVSYYPDALADAIAGTDLAPGYDDIDAAFSSTEPGIYYGTDGNPPAGTIDFESVVLHELGHGLGFAGSSDDNGGVGSFDAQPMIFDRFLKSADGTSLLSLPNPSTALGTAYRNPVFWGGARGATANGGTHVSMYAPSSWEAGSSIAHLDETTFGEGSSDSLMTPYLNDQEVVHRPGPVLVGVLQDMGWAATFGAPGAPTGVAASALPTEVHLSWTRAAENGLAITGNTIAWNDNGAPAGTMTVGAVTSAVIGGLTEGHTYTFTVAATNALGTGPASAPSAPVVTGADTSAPTISTVALPVFTTAVTVGLRYAGTDAGSGIASYDVRYRRAAFNGGFGALTYPTSAQATTATVRVFPAQPGYTYCFSARARDAAGNTSPWSAERCTATALDDRALVASTGWTRAPSSAYYLNTVTSTRASGRTLTRSAVQARRLYLVATTCSGCGTVGVYWNGALLRTVSLNAATTTYKRVITIKDFGVVRSGTLVVKTLNTGRTYIDGVDLSRV
ncbi:MAG: fibronectin type III domain-containing protein [Mycobacteriales bacterium]